MRKFVSLLALSAMALASAQPAAAATCTRAIGWADRQGAVEDMTGASEAVPDDLSGAPYQVDWIRHGRMGRGNNPGQFRWIMPWSVIFDAPGNRVDQAHVEVRNMKLMVLSKRTGRWQVRVSSDQIQGGYYSKDVGKGLLLSTLDTSAGDGNTVITTDRRYMAHFWPPQSRRQIDPGDVAGVYVSVEARMDPDDYAAGARYVMDAAADYWIANNAKWNQSNNNGDAAIGRLKLLTPQWRTFYMTTANPADLRRCLTRPGG